MSNKEKLEQKYLSDNQINIVELEELKEKLQTENNKRIELEFQLKERRKELHCQNEISRILSNTLLSADDTIEKIMFAIQPAMQFPDITEVCFIINGKSIKTNNYSNSKYTLVQNLMYGEKSYGEIKVCYREDGFQGDVNHVFSNEEYELIFSVGVRIITYLKRLEEKQKADKSLLLYNSFMSASPDALIITNLRAIIEYVSPATLKIFGYKRIDDLVGKSILDFIDESDQGNVMYEVEKMFEGDYGNTDEYKVVKGDGTLCWVGVNGDFIRTSEGKPEKLIFVVRDIENRKKAELELQKSEEMYRSLIESSDAAIMMLNQAGEYIFLNLKEAQRFGLKPEDFKGKKISDFFPAEQVTQMLADIQKVLAGNKGFSKEIPVNFEGIDSYFRINIQPVRNEYQVPFAALFYITDITQFKQGEEKIRISEERFRNLIENINDVLFTIDINGIVKYISPAVSKIFGYTAEEIVGRSEFDFMHPDDIPRVLNALKNVETNTFTYLDIRYIIKDGSIKWVRSTFSPIYKEGKLAGGNGILTDITQQKLAEEKLLKSEERFRNLIETISEVIYEIDVNGVFKYVSPSVEKITGFTPDELIGKEFYEFVYKDDIQLLTELFVSLPESEEDLIVEFRMPFKDGKLKWYRASVISKFSNGQFIGGYGSVIDISTIKEYSEDLKMKDFQHREAQRQAKLGHWDFDIVNNYLYWSDEMYCIFDIDPDNFAATYEAFLVAVHPDDRQRVKKAYQTSLTNKKPYEIIYKLLLKNGDIKYVNEKCISEFDDNDNPVKSLGTIMDITKQVILEQNLREKEERFEQIAEQSNTVIWEIDNNGMYTYVNRIAEKVWGYKPEELVGKLHYYDLHPLENRELFMDATMKVFAGKQQFVDLHNPIIRKDGNLIIVATNGIPVLDKNGNLLCYRGADDDITEKLKAEEELRMFKKASDAASYGIAINKPNGEILYVNETWAEMHGCQIDELIGKHLSVGHNENQMGEVLMLVEKLLTEGKLISVELDHVRKDGTVFPTLMNATIIHDNEKRPQYISATIIDITELKKTQQNLVNSELKYRSIFENIHDTYYETGLEGTIIEVSPSVKYLSKGLLTREDLIGKPVFSLYENVEDRNKLFEQIFKTGRITDFELNLINKNNEIIPVSVSSKLIFDDEGKPLKIIGSIRDITERKIAEENLRLSEEKYRSMFKNNKSVILIIDPENKAIIDANNAASEFYGWSLEELCNKKITDINILPAEKLAERIKEAVAETNKQFLFKHKLASGEIRDVEVFSGPVQDGSTIYLYSIIHDITDRKRAEEALIQSEKNLKEAQEIAKMGSWQYNLKTGEVKWSENYYSIFGINKLLPPLKLSEMNDLIHPDDRKLFDEKINEIQKTRQILNFDFRLISENGTHKWIEANMAPIFDENGLLTEIKGISFDVTDKKHTEEQIKNQKDQLQAIVKAIPDILFVIDGEGNFIEYYFSDYHKLLIPPEQIVGSNISSLFSVENSLLHLSNVKHSLLINSLVEYECSVNFKGESKSFEVRIIPIQINKVLCFVRDITERKQQELVIRKLSQAIEQSPVMTVITDKSGNIEYVNNAFVEITGYNFEDVKGKNARILKSNNTPVETYRELWNTITVGNTWNGEWINRKKNGENYWENVTISPIFSSNGNIINYLAIKQDSTHRKETEQKLKKFYLDLEIKVDERTKELAEKTTELENFFNVSLDLLCIADTDGNFLKVNKAWEDILGYKTTELENRRFLDFVHPLDIEPTLKVMRELEKQEVVLNFINRYRTRNNNYKYIEWHSVPVGTKIYAAARDITESKITTDFQHELLQISSKLTGIPFAEIKPSINMALDKIGKFLLADRAYIFEFSSDQTTMNNTYEWCNEGINPEIENLQDLPVGIFPEWMKKLQKNEEIRIPSVKDLPDDWSEEKAALEPQEIQSLLVIPLYSEKVLIGFAGLDFVTIQREFNSFEVNIVKLWGTMLTGLINNYRIENLLEQSRQNMITFFNTVDDFLFVIEEDGSIIYVNETVKKRLGYSVDELIGQSVISVHPGDRREEALQIIGEMMEEKADYCPVPLITKQGQEIQVETRVKKGIWNGKPAIFGVTKDISQIKLSEQKFASAFHSNSAVMTITRFNNSQFVDVNKAFTNTLGYSHDEIMGETLVTLGIVREKESEYMIQSAINSGIPVREIEVKAFSKSGDLHVFLLSAEEIFVGTERCILSVAVEITERKKMEKELIHARNEAQKANKAKSEFLSRMSHELRTPMNSILGFAQLLELGELNEKQTRGVNHILKSGKYLLNLINEVLELSRIESGRLSLSIENIHIAVLIDEILDFIHPQAESKKIEIEKADINPDLIVKADKQKLKQVLINLLINSVKYNKEFGRIDIKTEIRYEVSQDESRIRIMVTDKGIGISAENQKKLFSPFERIGADKTSIEGTGLGLTVSKKLIEAMNGTIGYDSKINEGSTFWVELPLVKKNKKQIKKVVAEKNDTAVKSSISGKVLYIEDNESNIELLEQIMNQNRPGVTMIFETNGSNAVLSATVNNPDLILLDINLPGIQGDEILSIIMENDLLKTIPVVVVSADATPLKIKSMLKLGARSYLTKPFNIHQLLKSVDQYLEKQLNF
jgi:PAS domain S-box-containing protein